MAGVTHLDLREALGDSKGRSVAVGLYPPWQDETSDVISGLIPDEHGRITPGAY
jgi:hypothetical protein